MRERSRESGDRKESLMEGRERERGGGRHRCRGGRSSSPMALMEAELDRKRREEKRVEGEDGGGDSSTNKEELHGRHSARAQITGDKRGLLMLSCSRCSCKAHWCASHSLVAEK